MTEEIVESNAIAILERLEALQREIEDIKKMVKAGRKEPATLKGILKGMTVSDADFARAKRSWNRKLNDI